MSYFVTAVAVKMSVFLNCVLGVVRCIQIVKPHFPINKKSHSVYICSLLYMVVWVLIVGLDIWQFNEKRNTGNQVLLAKTFLLKGQPGFGPVLLTMHKEQSRSSYLAYHLGNLIQFLLPTVLPTLLCFALMIVQLYHMPRKGSSKKSRNGTDKVSKASFTIFLLTCIYVITSGVSVVTWLIIHGQRGYFVSRSNYQVLMKETATATSWSDLTAIYFSLSTCPLICSTLTPLTLLLRGTGPAFSAVLKALSGSGITSSTSVQHQSSIAGMENSQTNTQQ